MAKISEFTKVTIVSSMTHAEASTCLTCLLYARGKFNSYTSDEFRTLVNDLVVDFKQAGVHQDGPSITR